MSCARCKSEDLKGFNGEIALHVPGLQGLDKPIVWVFPKVGLCLACGLAEFEVPAEQLKQFDGHDSRANSR